jgi:hypothetical protein
MPRKKNTEPVRKGRLYSSGTRKRNPEALRIEKDYKSKRAKIKSGLRSASAGQASEIQGQSREGMSVVGSQKPDPGAQRRKSWHDDRPTYDHGMKKGEKAKSRISKKKPKTEREYDAKKKLEKDKTPQDTPTFNTNPKKPKSSKPPTYKERRKQATATPTKPKPNPATAKPKTATRKGFGGIGSTTTLKKPDNWKSNADWKLLEGNPTKKKKKRKAPTYRG